MENYNNYFDREWGGRNIVNMWDDADYFDYDEIDEEVEEEFDVPSRVYRERVSPFESLTDYEFKRHFRFSKDNVVRLTEFMEIPRNRNNRGLPISPELSMCLFLSHLGGAHYNRVTGMCMDVSKNAAWAAVRRVRRCVLRKKDELIYLPAEEEMEATAERMKKDYGLEGFAMGLDGMLARFEEAPRRIPVGPGFPVKQSFWTRKMFYGINVLVVGNDKKITYALDPDWHGAAHDARIWAQSLFKPLIEQQRRFLVAGDSAFPISDVLIKPYTRAETDGNLRRVRFNSKLSGIRTVMTENLFAVVKRRFPWIKNMRPDYMAAREAIWCTFALNNVAQRWSEQLPDDGDGIEDDPVEDDLPPERPERQWRIVEDNVDRQTVRERGQLKREELCRTMVAVRRQHR